MAGGRWGYCSASWGVTTAADSVPLFESWHTVRVGSGPMDSPGGCSFVPVEAFRLWWPGQHARKRVLLLSATSANPLPPLPTHASARSAAQSRWARTHRRTVGTTWAVGQVPLAHSIASGPVARLNSFYLVFPACLCSGGVEVSGHAGHAWYMPVTCLDSCCMTSAWSWCTG